MKTKCPNCGEYKFEEKTGLGIIGATISTISILFLFFTYTVPGPAILGFIIGVILMLYSKFRPSKTVTYKCKNCDYTKKYLKKKNES